MTAKQFLGATLAVAIGTTIALAVAGVYLKQQLSAATAGNSTIGNLLALFGGSKPAGST